jgi:hypothetical protein
MRGESAVGFNCARPRALTQGLSLFIARFIFVSRRPKIGMCRWSALGDIE